jgi:endonuclease III
MTTDELNPRSSRPASSREVPFASGNGDRLRRAPPRRGAENDGRAAELPGVGRKTANVVLGHALGVPGLPVDRHVLRVSNRIGIARSEDPEAVEQQLCAAMPPDQWTNTSDTLILHGRRICKPKPLWENARQG